MFGLFCFFMKRKPVIVVNLKTYQHGAKALALCKKIEKVDKNIIVGVSALDVYRISSKTRLSVFCQHGDLMDEGRNTGFILLKGIKANGGDGVFLNHSEHRLKWSVLKKTILKCRDLKLKTLVFVKNLAEAKRVEKLGVDLLCWEPARLVGGNISVSSAKPNLIKGIRNGLRGDFLVGAGIKTGEDVRVALELGASGVALASGVCKAKDVERVLRGLINA